MPISIKYLRVYRGKRKNPNLHPNIEILSIGFSQMSCTRFGYATLQNNSRKNYEFAKKTPSLCYNPWPTQLVITSLDVSIGI